MIAALPRLIIVRLLAGLLLIAAGLQAGAPMAQVLERTHGSAFSASTHEVAITASRKSEVLRLALAPQPMAPPVMAPVVPLGAAVLPDGPAPRPDSTGPPAREILSRQPAPRAPPSA